MKRSLRWRDLVLGLLSLAAVAALSGAILVFGNVNALHGRTLTLFAAVGDARGVFPGTEVWVEGKKVGLVRRIDFQPASVDTARRLLVAMEVLDEFRPMIHADSRVQIRSGGTILGAPVIHVSHGTPATPMVRGHDTLYSIPGVDVESMASRLADAARGVPAIGANLQRVSEALRSPHGTLGAFAIERGEPELGEVQERLARLALRMENTRGTLGLAVEDGGSLAARARRVLARADSIRLLVSRMDGTVGRLPRDSTILRDIQSVRDELTIIEALLKTPRGTLGRARADSAILHAVHGTRDEMARLLADLRRTPHRYLHF